MKQILIFLTMMVCSGIALAGPPPQGGNGTSLAIGIGIGCGTTVIWSGYKFGENPKRDGIVIGTVVGLEAIWLVGSIWAGEPMGYQANSRQQFSMYISQDQTHNAPALTLQYRF